MVSIIYILVFLGEKKGHCGPFESESENLVLPKLVCLSSLKKCGRVNLEEDFDSNMWYNDS